MLWREAKAEKDECVVWKADPEVAEKSLTPTRLPRPMSEDPAAKWVQTTRAR